MGVGVRLLNMYTFEILICKPHEYLNFSKENNFFKGADETTKGLKVYAEVWHELRI